MEIIKLIGIGIILGVSNVIPGVSGGTMAVVFGVYDRFISVITINVKKIFAMWKFWLPLVSGMGIGILLFSRVISALFEHYHMATNWFFIGLIAGSLPLIAGKIKTASGENEKKPILSVAISAVAALGVMIAMDLLSGGSFGSTVETKLTSEIFIRLLAASALAAIAMIIPGISGSFLLLVLGAYTTIITAISDLNIPLLIPVAIGVALGLLGGAGLVRFLLAKIPAQTYGAILGLVAGSLIVIFPGVGLNLEMAVSVFTFLAGFLLAFFSSREKSGKA